MTQSLRARIVPHFAALLLLTLVAAVPRDARAQFAIDKTELTLVPGDSVSRTALLLVRNEGTERAQANIKVEDWDRAEDGTNRFYTAGTYPNSCAKGLTVFPLSVTLGPGESQYVRISYDPAAGGQTSRTPRECWSVVLVEHILPRPDASGRTLYYTLRTGAKVYVEPPGLTRDGQVSDVAIRATGSGSGREAEVAFQNTGTRHLVAKGHLEFRRQDNTVAASVTLPEAYALPGATARTRAMLPEIARGRYVVRAVLDYGGGELAAAQLEYEVP